MILIPKSECVVVKSQGHLGNAGQELYVKYPSSKFILTIRESPENWFSSIIQHAEKTGPTKAKEIAYGFSWPMQHKKHYINLYENHIREVQDFFAGQDNKLLIFCVDAGDGWQQLCDFLGTAVPCEPFPHANKAPSQRLVLLVRLLTYIKRRVPYYYYLKRQIRPTFRLLITSTIRRDSGRNPSLNR